MMTLAEILQELIDSAQDLQAFQAGFVSEMARGVKGKLSQLAMLPAYVSIPSGQEQGTYLAVDFGGTYVRVAAFRLLGQGKAELVRQHKFCLAGPEKDYRSHLVTGAELFYRLAQEVRTLSDQIAAQAIGLTFSFPFRQDNIREAYLTCWTKEFQTQGTEGKNIAALFRQALTACQVDLPLTAIINDTVAAYLAGGYSHRQTLASIILGTGHNAAYLMAKHPLKAAPMVVNLECGNFRPPRQACWDRQLDLESEKPGQQLLEKMVSGCYLEQLTVKILQDWDEAQAAGLVEVLEPIFPAVLLAEVLADQTAAAEETVRILGKYFSWQGDSKVAMGLREIVRALISRSARLASGTVLAICQYDPKQEFRNSSIVVEGSLYQRMPGYAQLLEQNLKRYWQSGSNPPSLIAVEEASALGAALAAAQSL